MPLTLPAARLQRVGFGLEAGMLPYPLRSFPGYRLLQEFFTFPEKFFFFDICGLEDVWKEGFKDSVELVFLIAQSGDAERRERLEGGISAKTVRLGCAPVVNLFSQTAGAVVLDQTRYQYPIPADARQLRGA